MTDAGVPAQRQVLVTAMVTIPALGVIAAIALAVVRHGVSLVGVSIFVVLYLVGVIGIEVGFHRYFSHRSFKCGPRMRLVLGACGSMAGQGPVLTWVATHRQHHRAADTRNDPHAPLAGGLAGFWRAHVGWLFMSWQPDIGATLPDLVRDPTTLAIHRAYPVWFAAGLVGPAILGFLIAGPPGATEAFLWGGLVRIFAVHHVTWSVNSLCHMFGQRPHATPDQSRNLWILALPSLGGAWHNNHHAFPASATNDFRVWQLDPSAWLIRGAARIGLVWDVREPPERLLRAAA